MEYFATLVLKALRKHGWPAKLELDYPTNGFVIVPVDGGDTLPPDFEEAFAIAVRIVARMYRVEVEHYRNWAGFLREYRVAPGGHFREVK
ncbi:hypothetical protein [Oceanicola sp. S124]|uniref:hypothetical protein n=1 Tax=Oceanicola sp. S124 TaxID=1042378 RepID=UPI00110FE868|nr:hypothetical protein [Oceanicola sp. S124]